MSFLIDTDTCSAYLKAHRVVQNRFLQHTGGLYISTVILGELYTWAYRDGTPTPKRLRVINDLLEDVHLLGISSRVAETFGRTRAEMIRRGIAPPNLDMLHAAVALTHDLTLVTHNTRDYINVPGLRLTDWLT